MQGMKLEEVCGVGARTRTERQDGGAGPLLWVAASCQVGLHSNCGQAELASRFLFCQVPALNGPKIDMDMKFAVLCRHK